MELDAVIGKDLQQTLADKVAKAVVKHCPIGHSGDRNIGPNLLAGQGRVADAEQL